MTTSAENLSEMLFKISIILIEETGMFNTDLVSIRW